MERSRRPAGGKASASAAVPGTMRYAVAAVEALQRCEAAAAAGDAEHAEAHAAEAMAAEVSAIGSSRTAVALGTPTQAAAAAAALTTAAGAAAAAPARVGASAFLRGSGSAFRGSVAGFAVEAQAAATGAVRVETVCKADPVSASYAAALAESAQEAGVLESVHADVETLAGYCKLDPQFVEFLSNPVLPEEQKKAVVEKLGKEAGFHAYTVNFLNLSIDKGRIVLLENVLEVFEDIYCDITDTQVAKVVSAINLDNDQQFLIAKQVQEMTGAKNVKLKPEVDEALLGGFVVQYGKDGSGFIDMSVKGQLEALAVQMGTSITI